MDKASSNGNVGVAIFAGALATIVGTMVCMGFALLTGWHVGYMAAGVGIVMGFVIRGSGRGSLVIFGALGVFFTLLTCLIGEMGVAIQAATTQRLDFYGVLTTMNLPELAVTIVTRTDTMMTVIYAIGIFFAFKLSRRG